MNDILKRLYRYSFVITMMMAISFISVGCSDDDNSNEETETIRVEAQGYTKSTLSVDGKLFVDDDGFVTSIHKYFTDFDILVSPRATHNGGKIIPYYDGFVYVIAPEKSLESHQGWKTASNFVITFQEEDGKKTTMSIYILNCVKGRAIDIPKLEASSPVYPLARKIIYQ